MNGREAMLSATRQSRWGPVPDPVAEFIMRGNLADAVCAAIPDGVTHLSGGLTSVVFGYGDDHVVRVGMKHGRPAIPEMLQPVTRQVIGELYMVEVLPRVQCDLTAGELRALARRVDAHGYTFADLGTDNAGRLPDGGLVVIDPGALVHRRELSSPAPGLGLALHR